MEIKISGIIPDINSSTENERNMFEEIALFLDSTQVQELIHDFRTRINLINTIPYDEFDAWKTNSVIQDQLTDQEKKYLYELDVEIDRLENRNYNELTQKEAEELNSKKEEKLLWLDPFFTFSRALEQKLTAFNKINYFDVLIKAIVCGEIRREDTRSIKLSRKGSRIATYYEREAYWLYPGDKIIGYGTVGRKLKVIPETITSRVNSYKKKLATYEYSLSSSSL